MKKPKHGRQRPDQSNQTHVLLAVDRQNSVLAELNNSDLNTVRYSVYGQRSAELNPAASVAFNGEFREPDTGWYLLGNGYRAYNPVLRRFHSPDSLSPFGSGGLNAYAYCVGDPINRTDPTGHFAFSLLSLAIYGVAAVSAVAGAASLTASFFVKDDSTKKNLLIAGGSLLVAGLVVAGARFAPWSSRLPRGPAPRDVSHPPSQPPGIQRTENVPNVNLWVRPVASPAHPSPRPSPRPTSAVSALPGGDPRSSIISDSSSNEVNWWSSRSSDSWSVRGTLNLPHKELFRRDSIRRSLRSNI
jgi:RHS repeat-associated protein